MSRLMIFVTLVVLVAGCAETATTAPAETMAAPIEEPTHVYWGDTHLHSNYSPEGNNLHRVVISPDGEAARKYIPFNSLDSAKPEDLWNWLEKTSEATGARFTAIPHNSNISAGRMFNTVDSEGRPITAEYARTRMK